MKRSISRSESQIVLALVTLAFLTRIGAWVLLPAYPLQDDTKVYLAIADNITNGWGFSIDNDADRVPEVATRDPGYPYFLALLTLVGVPAVAVGAVLIQILLNALAVVPLFRIAQTLATRRAAVIAAVLFALYPGLIVESTIAGHEGLLVPAIIACVWLLIRAVENPTTVAFAATGVAIGCAALLKQTTLGLAVVSAFVVVAVNPRGVRQWTGAAVLILTVAACLSPWLIRNMLVQRAVSQTVAHVMPEVNSATPAEMRDLGERIHKEQIHPTRDALEQGEAELPETKAPPVLETASGTDAEPDKAALTIAARAAYELYESDARRPVPVFSGSGGEIDGLVRRPTTIASRMIQNALNVPTVADVYLVPYENRYAEMLFPGPRIREVLSTGAIHGSTVVRLLLAALLLMLHAGGALGAALSARHTRRWPVIAAAAYFYAVPLLHSGPLNRFFFVAIPLLVILAAVAVDFIVSRYRERERATAYATV